MLRSKPFQHSAKKRKSKKRYPTDLRDSYGTSSGCCCRTACRGGVRAQCRCAKFRAPSCTSRARADGLRLLLPPLDAGRPWLRVHDSLHVGMRRKFGGWLPRQPECEDHRAAAMWAGRSKGASATSSWTPSSCCGYLHRRLLRRRDAAKILLRALSGCKKLRRVWIDGAAIEASCWNGLPGAFVTCWRSYCYRIRLRGVEFAPPLLGGGGFRAAKNAKGEALRR